MTKIYEQHRAAFASVSAYVILKNGERVATVAFKFPRDGAGRLYAYVHWFGVEMVRGHAGGYGYDKKGAAVESAVAKIQFFDNSQYAEDARKAGKPLAAQALEMSAIAENEKLKPFIAALENIGGQYFDRAIENAGFTVLQAV